MMKKIALLITIMTCIISFCLHSFAIDISPCVISIKNVDIIFDEDSMLSADEKQIVAEHLVNGQADAQTYGLICNLFGHKNTTEIVTTITHEVSSSAPRCLEEQWELTICSRCENTEETRIAFYYIYCCPED